jgi:protein-tyrosine-phosphatase
MARSNIRDRSILFLCRENSSLSFIAGAIAKKLLPPKAQIFSAGLKQDEIDLKRCKCYEKSELMFQARSQKSKTSYRRVTLI